MQFASASLSKFHAAWVALGRVSNFQQAKCISHLAHSRIIRGFEILLPERTSKVNLQIYAPININKKKTRRQMCHSMEVFRRFIAP